MTKVEKAYSEVLKVLNKHKDLLEIDIDSIKQESLRHIFGEELKEKYSLNIDPKNIKSTTYQRFGDHLYVSYYDGEKRKIYCSSDGRQPKNEYLVSLDFPTGAYIFGDGGLLSKDYPSDFFSVFWDELKSYNPNFIDEANHCLYWKLNNAKDIFNNFNDILIKYKELNREDIKQRKIKKLEQDLAKLKSE